MNKILLNPFYFIILILCLFHSIGSCGENIRWHDAGVATMHEMKQILVEEGLCKAIEKCSSSDFIFFKPTDLGIDIDVYGISSKPVRSKLVASASSCLVIEKMTSINVRFFRESKKIEMSSSSFFRPSKAELTINLEANYANY